MEAWTTGIASRSLTRSSSFSTNEEKSHQNFDSIFAPSSPPPSLSDIRSKIVMRQGWGNATGRSREWRNDGGPFRLVTFRWLGTDEGRGVGSKLNHSQTLLTTRQSRTPLIDHRTNLLHAAFLAGRTRGRGRLAS